VSAYNNVVIYVGLGDKDRAITWLQKAVDERSTRGMYFRVERRLDPMCADPRFEALVRRLGLPQ
jgi:hypothetical protein